MSNLCPAQSLTQTNRSCKKVVVSRVQFHSSFHTLLYVSRTLCVHKPHNTVYDCYIRSTRRALHTMIYTGIVILFIDLHFTVVSWSVSLLFYLVVLVTFCSHYPSHLHLCFMFAQWCLHHVISFLVTIRAGVPYCVPVARPLLIM